MEFLPLNKFEKEQKVIELHTKEGKTLKEISQVVHMSFRDISRIIKAYDKKVRLQQTKKEEENNQQQSTAKKLSLSSRAFILFRKGKKIDEVKVILDIPFKQARRFWAQYLKSIRMFESFEFYQLYSYDIPTLLSIVTFIKRNNVSGKDIVNVLRTANDVVNLNQIISNLKTEVNRLEQKKMYLMYYSHSSYYSLQPLLPLNKPNYNYYYY